MLELLCGAHGSLQAMGQANYINGFELTCHDHAVDLPLKWRKPQMIFVNSMYHSSLSSGEVSTRRRLAVNYLARLGMPSRKWRRHKPLREEDTSNYWPSMGGSDMRDSRDGQRGKRDSGAEGGRHNPDGGRRNNPVGVSSFHGAIAVGGAERPLRIFSNKSEFLLDFATIQYNVLSL